MKHLAMIQGSELWLASRQQARNASNAPSMMGDQSYGMTRNQLLHYMATGSQPEISDFLRTKFQQGHDAEAMARPIAEKIIGQELFPVVGESDDGYLRASFDGLTMDGSVAWEHKLFSEKLAEMIRSGDLSGQYVWQLEHQALVSGCEKILFMSSDGTEENCAWCWYYPSKVKQSQLLAGWELFDKDLAAYKEPQERNDQDWFDACERYREAKSALDAAQSKVDACKGELVELAGEQSAQGCGLKLIRIDKAGSISYSKLVKDLKIPAADLEKYRGAAPAPSYRIDL